MTGPWYSQQQVAGSNDNLFCIKAEYKIRDADNLSKGVVVHNSANKGAVNGELVDLNALPGNASSAAGSLAAAIPSLVAFPAPFNETTDVKATADSKLKVGPGIFELPYKLGTKFLFNDYWIVAVGESADASLGYDWAIVTSGSPKNPNILTGKCRTGNALGTNQGMWLLSRKPVDPEATQTMLAKAAALGLDTSSLKPVMQQGCLFGAAAPGSSTDAADDASSGVAVAAVPASSKKQQQGSGKAATPPASSGSSKKAGDSSAKVASAAPVALDPLAVTQKVEFNISIGGKPAGSVILGMFGNAAPKTVQNFVSICKGAKGSPSYVGTKFHRVIKDFMVQGGDFEKGDGTGGYSIYGASFPDENLTFELSRGVLAMANSGPDTNGSQFFITVVPTDWLNGKHVVFGRVLRGMELVDAISDAPVNTADAPLSPVSISGCRAWKDAVPSKLT
ncbi:hypothetical protein OEZ86_010004 [Tetradesmus obliquus]|uniref:peptidylprolyl isomerase n=1 Tax=Tetradesmus obliquus TaxID=3088 RepID=A0ABY8UNW7_TETOB|nr:hypothetical protein OEZ85_001438 [Tetradesmus obliquus]WIA43553.1 hypothetical protein OEZ86_010004 [Tetradesmus obliquus]